MRIVGIVEIDGVVRAVARRVRGMMLNIVRPSLFDIWYVRICFRLCDRLECSIAGSFVGGSRISDWIIPNRCWRLPIIVIMIFDSNIGGSYRGSPNGDPS
jgi:hypothetical protein